MLASLNTDSKLKLEDKGWSNRKNGRCPGDLDIELRSSLRVLDMRHTILRDEPANALATVLSDQKAAITPRVIGNAIRVQVIKS